MVLPLKEAKSFFSKSQYGKSFPFSTVKFARESDLRNCCFLF